MKVVAKLTILVFASTMLASAVNAQIKVGQTAGFTGASALGVKESTAGAKLYFDHINAEGGINGQNIELVSLDDKFEPALATQNAKKLIADPKVVALFLSRGTPHSLAIVELLSEHKITLIAPSTGAIALHKPVNPWVFNVRSTYAREAEHLTRHLSLSGPKTVAIVQVNDSFGEDAVQGALKVFAESGKKPAALVLFDRDRPDFAAVAKKVAAAKPLSVLFLGTGPAVVDGVRALRATGSKATIATLSNNASAGFIKSLGPDAQGTIISQVFPSPRSMKVALAAEAAQLAQKNSLGEVTPQMLEGFAAAKVLVTALKRCGKEVSRANIKRALETFNRVDIGGLEVSFSPADHTGLNFADLAFVSRDGTLRR